MPERGQTPVTTPDHDVDEFLRSAVHLGFRIPLADAQAMGPRFAQVQGALDGVRALDVSQHEPAVALDLGLIHGVARPSEGAA